MTIKEIANSLGVSTATVSNVIHGHLEKMSPETAQLVRKKLEQYQYIPNMGARMLAKGDSEIVGVITNYPNREEKFALQDPFVSEMIAALENAIRARGYYTMLRAAQTAAEIHRISQTWNAVGLIVMGLQANQCRELIEATRKPIVFVDCYFDEGEQYNNVGLDDLGGMRQLTETLLKLGHRNMLLVGDQPTLWGVDALRLRGHQQALSAAGIAWTQERYFCISKDRKRRSEDYRRLVECFRRMGCTACLFISDYYAVEAMDYLLDHGIRVPEDISVTGFDDNILSRIIILILRNDTHLILFTELFYLFTGVPEDIAQRRTNLIGRYGLVETYDEGTTSREVYTIAHSTNTERYDGDQQQDSGDHIRNLTFPYKIEVCIGQEVLGKPVREGHVFFPFQHSGEDQPSDQDCRKQRSQNTDDQGRCKTLYRTCSKYKQDDTGDQRGYVTVDNSRHSVLVTFGHCYVQCLAHTQLLFDPFVDDDVRIDRHTHRQHDTGNTRQGQYGSEGD